MRRRVCWVRRGVVYSRIGFNIYIRELDLNIHSLFVITIQYDTIRVVH